MPYNLIINIMPYQLTPQLIRPQLKSADLTTEVF